MMEADTIALERGARVPSDMLTRPDGERLYWKVVVVANIKGDEHGGGHGGGPPPHFTPSTCGHRVGATQLRPAGLRSRHSSRTRL